MSVVYPIGLLLKFSFSEKATQFWSYHPLDLMFTKQTSNQVGDKSNFFGLLRKAELYLPFPTGIIEEISSAIK